MKKESIILFIVFIGSINSYGQFTEQCVSCKGNTVSYNKSASAIGERNTATGSSSFAGGYSSQALGDYSIGFGYFTMSNGLQSMALGSESQATNSYGVAIGRHAYSTNANAIAIGKYNEASGVSSFSIGTFLESSAGFSFLIGSGVGFSTKLTNSIENSLMIGFNSTVPTFFIAPSSGPNLTGKVGIGNVTDPQAKLHIRADSNDDVTLRLEPGTGKVSRVYFSNTNEYYIQAANNQNMIFRTPEGKNFNFENGKISTSALQVTTGGGSGKLLQSDGSGNATWTSPAWTVSASNLYRSSGYVGIGFESTATLNNRLEVNGYANATSGYKVGNIEVISISRDYSGKDGTFSGALTVTGTSTLNGNVGIGTTPTPTSNKLTVNGTVEATSFSGSGAGLTNVPGDNLGNHTATQNIKLSGKWLSGDGGDEGIYVNNNGYVGIGTSNPTKTLHVNGEAVFLSNNQNDQFQILGNGLKPQRRGISLTDDSDGAFNLYIHGFQSNAAFNFIEGNNDVCLMTIKKNGNVGIGTTTPGIYKLAVAGSIIAEEVKIQLVNEWFDCVFKEDYNLMQINELESFIQTNKHLPDIPSEKVVMEEGINVGEMNALLLKKIEELTLYMIGQQKEINALKDKLADNENK